MDCNCLDNFFACVCLHDKKCRFRKAVTSAVGIECDHGYDVCPQCDACNCNNIMELNKKLGNGRTTKQFKVLDEIEKLENKYDMSSEMMVVKLNAGEIEETFEICQWLILLKARDNFLEKQ